MCAVVLRGTEKWVGSGEKKGRETGMGREELQENGFTSVLEYSWVDLKVLGMGVRV